MHSSPCSQSAADKCRWTKLIGKSGPDFSRLMDHMKTLDLPGLAVKYKDLTNKVMEHERNRYAQNFRALPSAPSPPMPMPMPMPMPTPTPTLTSSGLGFPDTNLEMDFDSQDDEFFSTFGANELADSVWGQDEDGFLHF